MAYGTKYSIPYKSGSVVRTINLMLDGYSGAATEWYCSVSSPIDEQGNSDKLFGDIIVAKVVRLEFLFDQDYDLTEFVAEPRTYKAVIVEGGNTIFEGYVEPYDTYHNYQKTQYFVSMTATCGLNRLSKNIFQQTEFNEGNLVLNYFELVQRCLATIGIERDIRVSVFTQLNSSLSAPNPLLSVEVNVFRYFVDGAWMDCQSIIVDILHKFNAQLFLDGNTWVIRSFIDHALGFTSSYVYTPSGSGSIVGSWDIERTVNYEVGQPIEELLTLKGGQISLTPRVRKYTTNVDLGGKDEQFTNGGLQLWDVNGPIGWTGNMGPALGGPFGWTKVETGIEGAPYALNIRGRAPHPYFKRKKKGIWPFRKTVLVPIEPEVYWETPEIELKKTDESINIGFEYFTEADSAGFLYTVTLFRSNPVDDEVNRVYIKPDIKDFPYSDEYQLLIAPPHPKVNPDTGITQSKGRVEYNLDLKQLNTKYLSGPDQPFFDRVEIWFYFSNLEDGKTGDEYTIYKIIGEKTGVAESEVPDGDSRYKVVVESNPYESDQGDAINLITGDYAEGFLGTTLAYGASELEPTAKWMRRDRLESISIYRAMMLDRLAVTYEVADVVQADIYTREGEEIKYLNLLRFKDRNPDSVYKIVRYSYNHFTRVASVTAVEVNYATLTTVKQRSYTEARGLLDETGDEGDGVYPGTGTPSGRIGAEEEDLFDKDPTEEELANARTGVFEDVPSLVYTVNEQATRYLDLEEYLSEFYIEGEFEDDIEEEDRHDPLNFVLSVVDKPSWLTVTFDGLMVIATAKPTVVGKFELELSVVDDTFGIVPNVKIPIIVYPKTTIKYTLRDTSGAEPLGVGEITNGSGFKKPDTWDILVQVKGHHEGWYGKLTGMGIDVSPTADPYSLVTTRDEATYIIGYNIDSEVGIYNLTLATYRDEGEPDNLKLVKRDKIRFTLFDEAYINKATFELWGAESGTLIGPINPDGSSAFNVEEAWDVKMIVDSVEHDAGTSVLGSDAGDLDTRTIGPLDPAVEDASYFQFGDVRTEFTPNTYNVLLTLKLDGDEQYVRAASFTINKEKIKPVGGKLQLVSMVPNTTNYNVLGTLALNGNLFPLPANGWNVLLESDVAAGTVRKHQLFQKKGASLVNIATSVYTGVSETKGYTLEVLEDQYFIFDEFSSKDIGKIHITPSSFRVIITDEVDGEVTNIYQADFSFGTLEDLDDLDISEPGNSGDGTQEYYAGRGLSEIVDDYIKTFNVNVDDATLEIYDQTNPLVNWLRIKDKGVTFAKMQDITGLSLIGKLTTGTGSPYQVPVINSTTLSGASDLNIFTSLAGKTYIDNKFTSTVTGLTGRLAKFATNSTLTYSILEESGISLTARQGIFVADNPSNANVRGFSVQEGGSTRFSFGKLGSGADFAFWRFADNGATVLGTPIGIERATGKVTLETQLTIQGSSLPPLVVSSSALVVNFNADLLDGQHGTYYLARANHTGTQLASTISNFSSAVLATTLTGLSTSNSAITSSDTILQAFGKVQGQITGNISGTTGRLAKFIGPNAIGTSILEESGILLTARQGIFVADNTSSTNVRGFAVQEGGATRFNFGKQGTAADFAFWRYADDGSTFLGVPIFIERTTGKVTLETQLTIQGSVLAPLVVSSSVLVTNFNADLLDGQHGAYYLDWNNFTNKKSIIAGAGLSGGGLLDSDRTVSLGTPSTLTNATTNSSSGTTHTHAIQVSNLVAGSNVTLSASGTGVILGPNNITISAVSMPWSNITSKPTTLSGFGIVDAPTIGDMNTALAGKENNFSKGNLTQGSGISLSGTLTSRLVNSGDVTVSLAASGVAAGTYRSVTVDSFGRVTSGSNPTTLAGYGLDSTVYTKAQVDALIPADSPVTVVGQTANRVVRYLNGTTPAQLSDGYIDDDGSIISMLNPMKLLNLTYTQRTALTGMPTGTTVYQTNSGTGGASIGVYVYVGAFGGWIHLTWDYIGV